MKKSRIITLLGTLTLALGGLVAFSQVSKKGYIEEAKAATATTVYYAISEADTTYYLKVEVSATEYAKYVAGTQVMAGVMTLSYAFAE